MLCRLGQQAQEDGKLIGGEVYKMQIWDTAGQESFKSITKIFYRGAHCIFLCFDLNKRDSFKNLANWHSEVMAESDSDILLVLIGTKADKDSREVSNAEAEEFRKENGIHFYFETSSKTGFNIERVFKTSAKMLFHNYYSKILNMREDAQQRKKGKYRLRGSDSSTGSKSNDKPTSKCC